MQLTYDPRHNVAYLRLHEKTAQVETIRISDELNVDVAPDGTVYGIELLNANEQLRTGWPVTVLLRSLVLQREKVWHDRELVQQLRDNARVRYLVGLPLGTRAAPSRTAIGDFRRAVVAAGLGAELFDQQVNWLGRLPALVDPQKDDFGIDATRFEAARRRVAAAPSAALHLRCWPNRRSSGCCSTACAA